MRTGQIQRVDIDSVIPYWRNPRQVTGEAVEALRRSLMEYGYSQPIVVDGNMSIIIGHTRYAAMRKLKAEQVDVMVVDYLSDSQVKELRVLDNRAAEYTSWDLDKLVTELGEMDSELLTALFPDVSVDTGVTEEKSYIEDTRDFSKEWEAVDTSVEFVCPTCFHTWEVEVSREEVLDGKVKEKS